MRFVVNEASLLIIIGLGFDVVGVLMILSPVWNLVKKTKKKWKLLEDEIWEKMSKLNEERFMGVDSMKPSLRDVLIDREDDKLFDSLKDVREKKIDEIFFSKGEQTTTRIGIGFLIFGFVLQIIGNWFLNPPL